MKYWHICLFNLAEFFKVKTVVTLAIVFTFCHMTIQQLQLSSEFVMIATAVITYYFTSKDNDKKERTIEEWEKK